MLGPNHVRLLNESADVAVEGWDNPSRSKLWRYNLHYFDDLNSAHATDRTPWHRLLMLRWVSENPPVAGTGWEAYPTSLRIVNWIKWALAGNQLEPALVESLAVQTRWLRKRLEIHLLGNHLFSNAKALVFSGIFFDGAEANRWLELGLRILERQMPRQILPDGGHFELSTMYHALALEDMLDLWNVLRTYSSAVPAHWTATINTWPSRIRTMRDWLAAMVHPDGEISYFNDATGGVAPRPAELERYASQLLPGPGPAPIQRAVHLASSGYVRVETGRAVALLDVARIGPDYLPAHAHADTLSFELAVHGQRVLVNTGTSCYGNTPERLRQRGTAAHNTIVVNGQNSSNVWSGFRVAERAHPIGLTMTEGSEIEIQCSHDGYRRLAGHPQHRRRWRFSSGELVIQDHISGPFETAQAFFHFHPSVRLITEDGSSAGRRYVIRLATGENVRMQIQGGDAHVEASTWCAGFGDEMPSSCLVVTLASEDLETRVMWGKDA